MYTNWPASPEYSSDGQKRVEVGSTSRMTRVALIQRVESTLAIAMVAVVAKVQQFP